MEQQHRARREKNKHRLMERYRAEKNDGHKQNRPTPSNRTPPVPILLVDRDKLQRVNGDACSCGVLKAAALHIKAENFSSLQLDSICISIPLETCRHLFLPLKITLNPNF